LENVVVVIGAGQIGQAIARRDIYGAVVPTASLLRYVRE
jgi:3-hydroxyacyl-CoA dehydrogenase